MAPTILVENDITLQKITKYAYKNSIMLGPAITLHAKDMRQRPFDMICGVLIPACS